MKYLDFVNTNYTPAKSDLVCDFFVETEGGTDIKRAAGGIAAESSVGTWTELTTEKEYMKPLAAKAFLIRKITKNSANIRIAYPAGLFEPANMPNILSSVAGNVFGLRELKNLRLNDIFLPPQLLKSFKGPKYGIDGIRKILKVKSRPLVGTIIKPKLGLKTKDHAKVAYDAWAGGCDIVKDDENLGSQKFNPFRKRFMQTIKMRDRAEKETGEKKVYMVNITAETEEMIRRAEFVQKNGGEYMMVDILTVGWSALQTLRNSDFNLVMHAHRAGHAAITKNPKHGISMKVIAKVARAIGVDQLHVGTVVGKMFETKEDVLENVSALKERSGLKTVFPVASGGLSPMNVSELVKIFGNDVIIQAGGGIHGHPRGSKAGATAMRQAVDAVTAGASLKEYAKTHSELKEALEHFG
ncbi:type III ribulose-bisphosphate carboxylase [archaeon]|nr:MAG: type III ribulose-bisphosphate carboxylase [archaeon]